MCVCVCVLQCSEEEERERERERESEEKQKKKREWGKIRKKGKKYVLESLYEPAGGDDIEGEAEGAVGLGPVHANVLLYVLSHSNTFVLLLMLFTIYLL